MIKDKIQEIGSQAMADVQAITEKYQAEIEESIRELAYRCKNETDAIKDEAHKKIVELVKDFTQN